MTLSQRLRGAKNFLPLNVLAKQQAQLSPPIAGDGSGVNVWKNTRFPLRVAEEHITLATMLTYCRSEQRGDARR